MAWRQLAWIGALSCVLVAGAAQAEPVPAPTCQSNDDDDEGVRFGLGEACAKVTAGISYTYQQTRQTAGVPRIINRNGTVTNDTMSQSVTASSGIEVTRQTALGEFKMSTGGEWSKSTGDGTTNGSAYFTGWSVGLGGLTAGYNGTLMSFWEGNFLTSASSPGRGTTSIVYEHEIDAASKIAIGVESSMPTSPNADTDIWSFDFSRPVYSLRWRRETEALTTHLSGVVRRADFANSPVLEFLPDVDAASRTGWAISAGFKLPAPFIAPGDEFAFQATYAVDASSYLGTTNDLVLYQSLVRSLGPTVGWSAVASYHHEWSDAFESNIFASFVTVQADLLLGTPESKTFRSAVNLYWKPVKQLKFGVELGFVDIQAEANGVAGFFNGVSGRSWIGTLSISAAL